MSALIATGLVGIVVAGLMSRIVPPAPRLAARTRPYAFDAPSTMHWPSQNGPAIGRVLATFGGADDALALRLHRCGLFRDLPPDERIAHVRTLQLTSALTWSAILAGVLVVLGQSLVPVVAGGVLGAFIGAARIRGRVDAAIAARRERIKVELYTVNQMLALHARVGGGVAQALQRVAARGKGTVVEELDEVLRAHRGGRSIGEALEEAARLTPEAHAARTYRLLARGADYGADLALGLRALSDDLRRERREALLRAATRRRAAMLVPIIGLLAPVMLLFVTAPLPSIVFGSR